MAQAIESKLTGATFAAQPPASAAQEAITAIMGIAPFGAGGTILTGAPSAATPHFLGSADESIGTGGT
jgi:hypothetical protein